jgi:hypothetical protein
VSQKENTQCLLLFVYEVLDVVDTQAGAECLVRGSLLYVKLFYSFE